MSFSQKTKDLVKVQPLCQSCFDEVVQSTVHVCCPDCKAGIHSGGGSFGDTPEFYASCQAEADHRHAKEHQ